MRSDRACLLGSFLSFALSAIFVLPIRGEFSGSYALTPPNPGNYFVLPSIRSSFGNWTCLPTARGLGVDTSLAPSKLILDTEGVHRPVAGYFFTRAAASGTVSFDYMIAGSGEGTFAWFNAGTNDPALAPQVVVTNLVSNPTSASLAVQAGDSFGFYISARGELSGSSARRTVTIQNFLPPSPLPRMLVAGSHSNLFVRWPGWATNFVLEGANSLSGAINWSAVTNQVTVIDNMFSTSLEYQGSRRFFRLRKIE